MKHNFIKVTDVKTNDTVCLNGDYIVSIKKYAYIREHDIGEVYGTHILLSNKSYLCVKESVQEVFDRLNRDPLLEYEKHKHHLEILDKWSDL